MAFRIDGAFAFEREYGMDRFEEEEDEEVRPARRLRRQYKMFPRINMDKWDDVDFVSRFRVSKHTTTIILEIIRIDLEFEDER